MDFNTLHIDYADFFHHGEYSRPKYDVIFYISLDAEWYESNGRNVVLSYQIATCSECKSSNIIRYMPHGKRLTLAEITELGIASVMDDSLRELRGLKVQVILISHNVSAEMSVIADRDESHLTKRMSLVRGSPITDGHNIKVTIKYGVPVEVKIFDTILLAPASHRSLKKLSGLLSSKKHGKESVTQFYIENMNLYLRDYPDRFQEYALRDSEITLMLFFFIQKALQDLAATGFKLFRTLASAGVMGFTRKGGNFSEQESFMDYKDELIKRYPTPYQLVKRSYHGGRNEGYFIGRTKNHPETKNKIWIDIDLKGCYPTAMALSPLIDLEKPVKRLSRKYKLTRKDADELVADNIPQETVDDVRYALRESQQAFDVALMKIPSKDKSWRIRQKASVVNNLLVDRWYNRWQKAKESGDTTIEKISIPGFARVRFTFPSDTMFPCLPVRHPEYGLLYVLEGETTVSAIELIMAMDAGAKIEALTSIEFDVQKDKDDDEPVRFILPHLADLANTREEYKADFKLYKKTDGKDGNATSGFMEKLVKEFTNSFYGKFSQSINPRQVFNPSTGEMVTLGESIITEPCTASIVTSLARAALTATLTGIERFNKDLSLEDQITVISATTDGLLMGIPAPEGFTVVDDYYEVKDGLPELKSEVEKQLPDILERFGYQDVLKEIDKFLPIRQMKNARKEMTGSNEIFEIKHLVDEVISVKTRGQIGLISTGETLLLARFGLKPPLSEILKDDPEEYKKIMDKGGVKKDSKDAEWIIGHLDKIENGCDEISRYPFITLNSYTKISKSKGEKDLTKNINNRKVNTDFDWKRRLVWLEDGSAISPFSVPHIDTAKMVTHRNMMESIRRTGMVASPEKILHRLSVKGSAIKARGGEAVTVTRLFLRGIVWGKIPLTHDLGTHKDSADKINDIWQLMGLSKSSSKKWTKSDFKNAQTFVKKKKEEKMEWEDGCILPNTLLEELTTKLVKVFHADADATKQAIFSSERFKKAHSSLIEYVVTAIVNAPELGISPFYDLHKKGLLPGRQKMLDIFQPQLSQEHIESCFKEPFTPGRLPSYHAPTLKRLFYRLGLPNSDCLACARSLAPPTKSSSKSRKNPGARKCSNHFIQAIMQADIRNRDLQPSDIVKKLKRYGVTKSIYFQLKKGRFTPNCIKDTPQNKSQIIKMAKACTHDPAPLLDVLIEKS